MITAKSHKAMKRENDIRSVTNDAILENTARVAGDILLKVMANSEHLDQYPRGRKGVGRHNEMYTTGIVYAIRDNIEDKVRKARNA